MCQYFSELLGCTLLPLQLPPEVEQLAVSHLELSPGFAPWPADSLERDSPAFFLR